ncbi:putative reverse transcriptase domain-containing protein [Tanacetum coccineum]
MLPHLHHHYQVASSPLPIPSPLTTSPTDAGAPLGYRAAGIRMRAAVASPPSLLPSTSHRTDVPEAEMPPQKRACLTTPSSRYEIGREFSRRQRTEEFQVRFEEAYDDRAYLNARVNILFRDRPYPPPQSFGLLDREARLCSHWPWTSSEEKEWWNAIEAMLGNQWTQRLETRGLLDEPAEAGSNLLKATKTQSMQEAIEFSTEMMGQKGGGDGINCKRLVTRPVTVKFDLAANNNNNNNNQRTQGAIMELTLALSAELMLWALLELTESNAVMGTFLLNNRYASILSDTGADRSFISTAFSSLIDIIPTTLDHGYDVALADASKTVLEEVVVTRHWGFQSRSFVIVPMDKAKEPFKLLKLCYALCDSGWEWLEVTYRDRILVSPSEKGVVRLENGGESEYEVYWTFQGVSQSGNRLLIGLELPSIQSKPREPVEILDREVKKLRRSRIPIIKVRWNSKRGPEFTWEREDQFREKYPSSSTKTAPRKCWLLSLGTRLS